MARQKKPHRFSNNINKKPRGIRRLLRVMMYCAGLFVVGSILLVMSLRWVDPWASSFMLQRQVSAWVNDEKDFELAYTWVAYEKINADLSLSVIASEDQKFLIHNGFDVEAIRQVLRQRSRGETTRGASTISQQMVKNMFLWPDRSWFRKGMEAYFTVLVETLLPKQRILEIYLNTAEFGDGIYGAQAAAEKIFLTSAIQLTPQQSALLAARLPAPKTYQINPASDYMLQRADWIRQQIRQMGAYRTRRSLAHK